MIRPPLEGDGAAERRRAGANDGRGAPAREAVAPRPPSPVLVAQRPDPHPEQQDWLWRQIKQVAFNPHQEIACRNAFSRHDIKLGNQWLRDTLAIVNEAVTKIHPLSDLSTREEMEREAVEALVRLMKRYRDAWVKCRAGPRLREEPLQQQLDRLYNDDSPAPDAPADEPTEPEDGETRATRLSCLREIRRGFPDAAVPVASHNTVKWAELQICRGKLHAGMQALNGATAVRIPTAVLQGKIQEKLSPIPSETYKACEKPEPLSEDDSMEIADLFRVDPADNDGCEFQISAVEDPRRFRAADAFGLTREAVCLFVREGGVIESLVELYRFLAAGWVPPTLLGFLSVDRRIGIAKKGDPDALRPISIRPNLLLPLEKMLSAGITRRVIDTCSPQQFGGGVKCGSDALVLAIRAHLDEDPDAVVAHVDCSNAFGNVDRAAILRSLADFHSPALHFVAGQFGTGSPGVVAGSDGEVQQTMNWQGVPQGSPLSPGLFCLAIDRALKEASRKSGQRADVLAIADDAFIVGRPDKVEKAFLHLQKQLSKVGLALNPSKTEFFSTSADSRGMIQAAIDDPAKPLGGHVSQDGIVVAGIPITQQAKFIEDFVKGRIQTTAELVMCCLMLSRRTAARAYRGCIVPMWSHLFRSGVLLNLEDTGTILRLKALSRTFGDYLTGCASAQLHPTDSSVSEAIREFGRRMPMAEGGMQIELVPSRLGHLAMFAGMILDVAPGLVSMAKRHDMRVISEVERILGTLAQIPVGERKIGLHNAHWTQVGDWALRTVWDQLRKLIRTAKEIPREEDKAVCFVPPLKYSNFPEFMRCVWNPDSMADERAVREMEDGIRCAQTRLCTPHKIKGGPNAKDQMATAKRDSADPPQWILEPKCLQSWIKH